MKLSVCGLALAICGTQTAYGLSVRSEPPAASASGASVSAQALTKLAPGDLADSDRFGQDVAISGDTAVIGCALDGDNGTYSGSAYVYVRSGGTWTLQQKLTPKPGEVGAGDVFGNAVGIFGDTIVVGAQRDDDKATDAGSVFVFKRSGSTWTQQARILPSDGEAGNIFGTSVAIDGDTLAVGAPFHGTGAVYVYVGSGSSWIEQQQIELPPGDEGSWFGIDCAVDADTVAIGCGFADPSISQGAAFVYVRSGGAWTKQAKLMATEGPRNDDSFGASLGISGDRLVVGSPGFMLNKGEAYVFGRSGAVWSQEARLFDPAGTDGDAFAGSVAIEGDLVLVGAWMKDGQSQWGTLSEMGSVFPYVRVNGVWTARAPFSSEVHIQNFGYDVAVSGATAIIGAPGDWATVFDGGCAYAWTLESILPVTSVRIAGANRYATSVEASKHGFQSASTVVIATGENFPDALGGSALAGVVKGPMLLTRTGALPAEVRAEIVRLKATKAYILGGTGAVSSSVENTLVSMLGRANVVRLAGPNRYETARKVADEVIRLLGAAYSGWGLVATGAKFPDALAASPLAARFGVPILLANPTSGALYVPTATKAVIVLGGTTTVSAGVETSLKAKLGASSVTRIAGNNRYDTAAFVALTGALLGMQYDGVGIATGENFPDALSGGAMLGAVNSVMLLTRPTSLSPGTAASLSATSASIQTIRIFGGPTAVSPSVEAAAKAAARP